MKFNWDIMQSVKVVFHIDEVEKWPLLLAYVRNLVKVVDVAASKIVVLVNSKAVSIFDGKISDKLFFGRKAQPNHADSIQELAEQGIEFIACQNSLNGLSISFEYLPEYRKVVSVGVLELINKQSDGFAYIKP
jgi:intracellular sulfur oxidation DsrE/DsrF family protein